MPWDYRTAEMVKADATGRELANCSGFRFVQACRIEAVRYDTRNRMLIVAGLFLLLALMSPMGLEQHPVDLLQVDDAGAVADGFE